MTPKFINFRNLAELEEKLEKLKIMRDQYQQESKNWLITHNIPFFEADDLSLHIDLGSIAEDIFDKTMQFHKQQELEIKNYYRELGVIYFDCDVSELKINYENRKN